MRAFTLLWCGAILFGIVSAQARPTQLQSWLDMALKNNRELSLKQVQEDITAYNADINSTLPDPMFMIEFRGMPYNPIDPADTREWMFMLQQAFPFPGKLEHQKAMGQDATKIQSMRTRALELYLTMSLETLYYQLQFNTQAGDLDREILDLLIQTRDVTTAKLETGSASLRQLEQIRIEIAKVQARLAQRDQEFGALTASLNEMLGRPQNTHVSIIPDSTIWQAGALPEQIESLIAIHNPYVRAAAIKIDQQETQLQLAKLGKYPDLTLMGGYMAMQDQPDRLMGRVAVTLPFMPWASHDTRLRTQQAQKNVNTEKIIYNDILAKTRRDAETLQQDLKAIQAQLNIYTNSILPSSRHAVELTMAEYQTGTADFTDLLTVLRDHYKYRLENLKLYTQYQTDLSRLYMVCGIEQK